MAKFEKGEFLSKVEAFAKEMSEKTNGNKNRSIIILAAERYENMDEDTQIIAMLGYGEKLKDVLVSFFPHPHNPPPPPPPHPPPAGGRAPPPPRNETLSSPNKNI